MPLEIVSFATHPMRQRRRVYLLATVVGILGGLAGSLAFALLPLPDLLLRFETLVIIAFVALTGVGLGGIIEQASVELDDLRDYADRHPLPGYPPLNHDGIVMRPEPLEHRANENV